MQRTCIDVEERTVYGNKSNLTTESIIKTDVMHGCRVVMTRFNLNINVTHKQMCTHLHCINTPFEIARALL